MKSWRLNTSDGVESALRATLLGGCVIVGAFGCAATPTSSQAPAAAKDAASASPNDCKRALDEAVRFHNAAVEFMNADRPELAVNQFDDSVRAWQRVTDGTLRCGPDALTFANDGLQKTQFEQDRARAKAADKANK